MKHFLTAIALIVASFISTETFAADGGVSISLGQPGFYGRLDIGGYPPPQVIYQQPQSVWRTPVNQPPIYMRVPSGHARHWKKHCGRYTACNERVFFVRDNWYNREYAPRYQEQHGERGEHRNDNYDNNRRDDYRDKKHHDDNRGEYQDKGHGNHHGHGRNH